MSTLRGTSIDYLFSIGLTQDELDKYIGMLTTIDMHLEHINIDDAWKCIIEMTDDLIEVKPTNGGTRKVMNIFAEDLAKRYEILTYLIRYKNNDIARNNYK